MATKYKWDNVSRPSVENKWSAGQSLGDKIETMFTRFVQRAVLWVIDFVSDRLVDVFDNSMKILQPGVDRAASSFFQEMTKAEGLPEWFKASMKSVESEKGESGFFLKLLTFYVSVRSIIIGGLGPAQRWADYNADIKLRSFLPDPASLAFMRRIGIMSQEGYIDAMQKLGLHDKLIPLYDELSRNLPTTGESMAGLWRGVYNEQQFKDLLKRSGSDPKDIELYIELSKNIPPLSDLIRMLVRDAFNEAAVQKYGYDEDFPKEINQYFEKQGFDPDWAKRYWRSHWELPSPMQGYEMLHRGLITADDLETLLKISDYPPFWRDKLAQISYNVLTRVDVRRLMQTGLIDRARALEAYQAMGYTPEDAELLTQFAEQGITQNEKDLTKTDVLDLYEEGLTDRGSTAGNLIKMGYDAQEAEAILQLTDVRIAKAARTDLINYTKERYLGHKIEEGAARSELTQIGLKSQSVDRYIFNWQRATEIESAIPSLADVRRWYKADYIDETKLRFYLALHRHTPENIEIYVKELNDAKEAQSEQA